jgi:electron transfer flavoprotein alpha subunit
MAILLLAEHDNVALSDQTAKALTAAHSIGGDVHILVAGQNAKMVADAAAKMHGVAKVILADAAELGAFLAENVASLMVSMAGNYDTIMAPSTPMTKNIMPRVAAMLDVMQLSDIVEVVSANTFKRPIYAGNAIQTVQSGDGGSTKVETIGAAANPHLSSFLKNEIAKNDRPELTSAKIIISGGRALGSKEKFDAVMLPVADALGAAVGASRAAVDAGYAPNDWQVGQTGKVVAPDLYIAAGISGAIQHLAGMKDSKIIVAINKDEEAPIFQVADYGLVADLFEALPEMQKAV